ncbi:MAG: flagellar motor switch protein FliM [Ignavibacteriae bacterium]|nr:flagellar motor switch protein FliM [Ignavibacteriota bacterium]MCB0749101.1 flagellar motor switch protein FliM [Ignavibacteriota bacterium]MCB0751375.1 flagellar motor switch protein FliM [Ignavibacteriota bacterium]MCB9248054.1 flagellar motor switch protein FliM [Ignavibacteriales bacterium]
MAEVLSQQEIDALLNGGASEAAKTEKIKIDKEVIPFDFRLPNRISKNQLRTIHNINENFAEMFGSYLMTKLQTIVSCNVTSVDQIYYSEYVLSVSNPACLFTFDINHTDIKGILEFSSEFALTLVDRLLGGNGKGSKSSQVITPIEQKVLEVVINKILNDLGKAWQIIGDYTFKIDKFEPDIDFVQITSQSESVLLITFEVHFGEESFMMNLCFATYAFDTILSKLTNQNLSSIRPIKYQGTTSANILTDHLKKTELNLEVEFGKSSISFSRLLKLKKGDVILLNTQLGDEIKVSVEKKHMFDGISGVVNNHKAVKITKKVDKRKN